MAVTQIIGPRIAPLWADPVEWTSTRAYEPFTFVTYQGDSYCSRQDTPIGIQITNDDYWVKVSDYNAQAVALQRSMTQTIETAETNMANTIQTGKNDITKAINDAETSMQQSVADVNTVKNEFQSQLDQVTTNKNNIATNATAITELENDTMIVIGDSFSVITSGSGGSEGPLWWDYLKHAYNFKVADSFAISGAGFVHSYGNSIPYQVNQAIAKYNTNAMIKRVNAIYILGGLNDMILGTTAAEWNNALLEQYNKLQNHFTNAKIFYMLNATPYFTNQNISFNTFQSYLSYMQNHTYSFPAQYMAPYVEGRTNLYRQNVDDNKLLHPNMRGEAYIAQIWMGCAQNIPVVISHNRTLLDSSGFTLENATWLDGPCNIQLSNGMLTMQVGLRVTDASQDVIVTIPEWLRGIGGAHSYVPCFFGYPDVLHIYWCDYNHANKITIPTHVDETTKANNMELYLAFTAERSIIASAVISTSPIL